VQLLPAPAALSFTATTPLSPYAPATLPLTAIVREVSSEMQRLSPRLTFVSPLLLTHTSPPCAKAAPDTATIAAMTTITESTEVMRLIHPPLSWLSTLDRPARET